MQNPPVCLNSHDMELDSHLLLNDHKQLYFSH